MTDETKERLLRDFEEMTRLTDLYSAATTEIITTDIDETLDEIVARRSGIIEAIGKTRQDIDDACLQCTEQESTLIKRMITGGHIPLGISKELREIHKAAVKMHSSYLTIADKEKQASVRVDARLKELRYDLQNVNADRKKATGYTAIGSGFGGSGSSFDGRL